MRGETTLRWMVTQGVWSLGASGFVDFLEKTKQYALRNVIAQIKGACLIMKAEGDQLAASKNLALSPWM